LAAILEAVVLVLELTTAEPEVTVVPPTVMLLTTLTLVIADLAKVKFPPLELMVIVAPTAAGPVTVMTPTEEVAE
jgi:hypothetical protein